MAQSSPTCLPQARRSICLRPCIAASSIARSMSCSRSIPSARWHSRWSRFAIAKNFTASRNSPADVDVQSLSPSEVDYPLMRDMHAASSLKTEREIAEWLTAANAMSAMDVRTCRRQQRQGSRESHRAATGCRRGPLSGYGRSRHRPARLDATIRPPRSALVREEPVDGPHAGHTGDPGRLPGHAR